MLIGENQTKLNAHCVNLTIDRFRITLTANGKNEHVIMFALYLPLTVFSFSVKSSSFALASKARIRLRYPRLCPHFFKET